MTTFNLENLNELAEQSEILKACMDAADRELTSYGEALEAAVTFLVLENKDLREQIVRLNTANSNLWRIADGRLSGVTTPAYSPSPTISSK